VLASGARLACDAPVLATPRQAPAWLRKSGLVLDGALAPAVTHCLHSAAHPSVFGPGPAGPAAAAPLAAQLRRALSATPLRPVALRQPTLRWLELGRGRAAVVWRRLVLTGLAAGAVHSLLQPVHTALRRAG
jgi:hypothetical protein